MHPDDLRRFMENYLAEPNLSDARDALWALAQDSLELPAQDQATRLRDAKQRPEQASTLFLGPQGDGGLGAAPSGHEIAQDDRYEELGTLGSGGMGEILRVRDRSLNRVLAMKVMLQDPDASQTLQETRHAWFLSEAQITAQLEHPAIVPVHEVGQLPDGRPYFTMTEINGSTLTQKIREHHNAKYDGQAFDASWTLRRLVEVFYRACEAVAYAHDRRVVHRDLKPSNIMVGAFGEVLVLDWGIARVLDDPKVPLDAPEAPDTPWTERQRVDLKTTAGTIAGTPSYMAPEQATGQTQAIDERTDVYALGAILYTILCGRPPYVRRPDKSVLEQVQTEPPRGLFASDDSIPSELADVAMTAMARDRAHRFTNASGLIVKVRAWLDGVAQKERAQSIVDQAHRLGPAVRRLRREADDLRAQARATLAVVHPAAPEEEKREAWQLEDRVHTLEQQIETLQTRRRLGFEAALRVDPHHLGALEALATIYRRQHEEYEERHPRSNGSPAELLLRTSVEALPQEHPARVDTAAYLQGDGLLSLQTEPSEASVRLHRYEQVARRLVTTESFDLGETPLRRVTIARGSYLAELSLPDRPTVRYPIQIERQQHWQARPEGAAAALAISIPESGALGPDDCYVGAGPTIAGGDEQAPSPLPRHRRWVDGFVIRRFPVTNGEFLVFLNDLIASGEEEQALRCMPQMPSPPNQLHGAPLFERDGDGRFRLPAPGHAGAWEDRHPVVMVSWRAAAAFAAWMAAETGQPWRLPTEFEWEKAARGADARAFPFGDHFDPSWACTRDSHRGPPKAAPVDAFPVDESPYGVRGLCGNVMEWTQDAFHIDGLPSREANEDPAALRVIRGGMWSFTPLFARSADRRRLPPDSRFDFLGFRIARSV